MISGGTWSAKVSSEMASAGMIGPDVGLFSNAVGIGSASHVAGKAFTTTDTGTTPGIGTGVGTGITGLVGTAIGSAIFGAASALFGGSGPDLLKICNAIGAACVQELALATLSSNHNPVYVGSGIVDIGSIAVAAGAWGSSIQSSVAFTGGQWANFASAMGTGCAGQVMSSGTGTVTITGSPTGPPVPGGGTGSGTIS